MVLFLYPKGTCLPSACFHRLIRRVLTFTAYAREEKEFFSSFSLLPPKAEEAILMSSKSIFAFSTSDVLHRGAWVEKSLFFLNELLKVCAVLDDVPTDDRPTDLAVLDVCLSIGSRFALLRLLFSDGGNRLSEWVSPREWREKERKSKGKESIEGSSSSSNSQEESKMNLKNDGRKVEHFCFPRGSKLTFSFSLSFTHTHSLSIPLS